MVGGGEVGNDDGVRVEAFTILLSWLGLSTLIFGLVDGEMVVAAVKAVTTEADDVVVDTDVVEVVDAIVWADVAEETDIFFLALSDYMDKAT